VWLCVAVCDCVAACVCFVAVSHLCASVVVWLSACLAVCGCVWLCVVALCAAYCMCGGCVWLCVAVVAVFLGCAFVVVVVLVGYVAAV
jgi:hypothetical protein